MNSKQRRDKRYERRKAARESKKASYNQLYGIFEEVFTFDNLYKSYKKCCCGVGWKSSTQRYRANALLNITKTQNELMRGKYKGKGFYEFDIFERGKPRHIKSVHISERVVQRCLCDYALVPMLARTFIHDNGACMKNKGIDFALNRLGCHLQRHWRKYGNEGYALMFDFSKFFDNIHHAPLIAEIQKQFTDARIVELASKFINDFGGGVGIGLGSQISQVCALAYPNRLDHFIKEVLHIKGYGRYMDDGYLIHHDKTYLQYCLAEIKKICNALGIILNPKKTQIVKLSSGITFLKTKFNLSPTGRVIRRPNRRGITTMRRKLKIFKTWYDDGKLTMADIKTSYSSWRGHIKRCNSYKTLKSMDELYKKLFKEDKHSDNG